MFGLGMGEILIIAVVALLFVGPDKLPAAAKSLGKGIRELRRSTRDLRDTLERDTQLGDAVREIRSALHDDGRYIPPRAKPIPSPATDVSPATDAPPAAADSPPIAAAPAPSTTPSKPDDDREPA